ncbi:MAG: PIN domain-containing protein [Phycisphaerales bacterium]|nr:MAG: PIN domain-containing protein [Phycisphaerales bacterium]
MKTLVVDASVAVKWFLPEEGREAAGALLSPEHRLIAPDLLWIEVASVFWKLARRGSLTPDEAQELFRDTSAFPVEICPSAELLPEALRIANETDRTVYDSLYIALAAKEKAQAVTADERLVNALSKSAWKRSVRNLV